MVDNNSFLIKKLLLKQWFHFFKKLMCFICPFCWKNLTSDDHLKAARDSNGPVMEYLCPFVAWPHTSARAFVPGCSETYWNKGPTNKSITQSVPYFFFYVFLSINSIYFFDKVNLYTSGSKNGHLIEVCLRNQRMTPPWGHYLHLGKPSSESIFRRTIVRHIFETLGNWP